MYQYTGDPNRSRSTARDTLDWVREAQDRGAGEIVLNCMASDGVRRVTMSSSCGRCARCATCPLIASGGAGSPRALRGRIPQARVDAALAASVFHSGRDRDRAISSGSAARQVEVRL